MPPKRRVELDIGAAGKARAIDLGKSSRAPALRGTESGLGVVDDEEIRGLEQGADVRGQAALVQRHVVGQLREERVVRAAQLIQQRMHLGERSPEALRRVVGDRQRYVLPRIQVAKQAAVRRHEADAAHESVPLRVGHFADIAAEKDERRAVTRFKLIERGEHLLLVGAAHSMAARRVDPHVSVGEDHRCAVTRPKNATP